VLAAQKKGDFGWLVAAVAVLALALRAMYLLSIRRAFFFEHLMTEPARYDAWAWDIVRGMAPVRPPFDEAPGYPYFVALVYRIAGRSHIAVAGTQALLDTASCAAVTVAGRRIAGERAGLFAGLLLAVSAPAVYFVGQLEPATMVVAVVSAWLLATPYGPARGARWVGSGAVLALGMLARSELLVALPAALVHAALVGGRRAVACLAAVPALLLVGWLAVNYASSGHLVLTTTGSGANLWIGNGPHADGVSPFLPEADPVAREVEQRADDAVTADAIFRERALSAMLERPAHTLGLGLKKLAWTFSDRELPNASDIEWETSQSWVFRLPLFPLSFGLLLPLALVGLIVGDERRRWLAALLAPVSVAIVICVALFTNARFRMVMLPSLALLGGIGLAGSFALLRRWPADKRRWRWIAAALVAGVALAWSPLGGVRGYRIPEIDVNTARLELADGHSAEAVARLRGALTRKPDDAPAWLALGTTLERMGSPNEASRAWADAERALPGDPAIAAAARTFRIAHPDAASDGMSNL
jgi:4-amino-4-deoxy-L-arabinose transferase-like glycosyltransferase